MFKKIFSIFGFGSESKEVKPKERLNTSNVKVPYKENLIPTLLNEHRVLLKIYSDTLEAAKKGDTGLTKLKLSKFKELFKTHLTKESVFLYTYLNQSLNNDDTVNLVNSMKTEMHGIGGAVNDFLELYTGDEAVIDGKFITELEGIGAALVQRIQSEESQLYPTYKVA